MPPATTTERGAETSAGHPTGALGTTTEPPAQGAVGWLLQCANRPIDPAGLTAFRVVLGVLIAVGAFRFVANGWVEQLWGRPTFFFRFEWAPWAVVGPTWLMTAAMVTVGICGLMIALGALYRVATLSFVLVFGWLELTDITNYLNHYYLLFLLGVIALALPLNRNHAVDALVAARRRGLPKAPAIPLRAWMVWLLRFQVGLVYVFAALAKANSDWLVHGQPLNLWLAARTDTPLIGPWLGYWEVALAMSWAGFIHDLLAVPALLWRRTRGPAYAVLVVFHLTTGVLFNIGMFPLIMIGAATVFFAPGWPRALLDRLARRAPSEFAARSLGPGRLGAVGVTALLVWGLLHVAVPLRFTLHDGPVNWHEQGMRFAWKVMVREKNGSVTYRVHHAGRRGETVVFPGRYLTPAQEREMSGQPDLIRTLARRIAADFRARGHRDVQVRADVLVSWNGRPAARLIDPEVDLAGDDLGAWILPAPSEAPPRLRPARTLRGSPKSPPGGQRALLAPRSGSASGETPRPHTGRQMPPIRTDP